jgi:hypothetical protein
MLKGYTPCVYCVSTRFFAKAFVCFSSMDAPLLSCTYIDATMPHIKTKSRDAKPKSHLVLKAKNRLHVSLNRMNDFCFRASPLLPSMAQMKRLAFHHAAERC